MTRKKNSRWNPLSLLSRSRRARRSAAAARDRSQFRASFEPLEDRRLLALTAGDIVVIDWQSEGTGGSSDDFVTFLPLVPISAGDTFYFTDSGVKSDGTFRTSTSEGGTKFVAENGYEQFEQFIFSRQNPGTEFSVYGAEFGTAVLGDNDHFEASSSGDQVIIFIDQNPGNATEPAAEPTYIYGLYTNGTTWDADSTSNKTSAEPPNLGDASFAFGDGANEEFDNIVYNGPRSFTDKADALGHITNVDNWIGTNEPNDTAYLQAKADNAAAFTGGGGGDTTPPTITAPANIVVSNDPGQASAAVTVPAATASDDVGIASVLNDFNNTADASDTYPIGTTTVIWTATDTSDNTAQASHTITVIDNENPTISVSANITVNNDPGQASAVVNYTSPTASDNAPGVTVAQTAGLASGSAFPIGTTTNTFLATDASGNTAAASFTVTVNDIENPTIAVPSNITVNNDPGQASAAVNYAAPTASDNAPGVTVGQTAGLASGSSFPIGTTTNTFIATDGAGNTASDSFTVTVVDNENPSISVPSNITVNNDPGQAGAVVNYTSPSASDNAPGVTVGQTAGLASGSAFPIGTTTNTFIATDGAGNTASDSFTVTVVDNENPTISVSSNITVNNDPGQASAVVNYTSPTASDNAPGVTFTQTAGLASGSAFPIGTTTNTFVATDASGNTASASFTVTVNDVEAPVLQSLDPADDSTGVSPSTNLVATFNENVQAGTGNVTIHLAAGGTLVQSIDVTGPGVSIAGSVVTVNPADLAEETEYYVNIPAGAIQDPAGNDFAGITDATTWSFTTGTAVPAGTIVDNDDPGFVLGPGPFQGAPDPLFVDNDFRYQSAGDGSSYVDYQFSGLTPGQYYSVAATWVGTPYAAASNAPFRIYDGLNPSTTATPLSTVRVNQNIPPNDFVDEDVVWERLDIVQVPAGETTLTVRLSDDANSWVYADAVRIEGLLDPEVEVLIGGQASPSGQVLDFGTVLSNTPTAETIEVTNLGQDPLNVTNLNVAGGPGIQVNVNNFTGTVTTGDSFTMDVVLDLTLGTGLAPGQHSWSITFNTNDPDEPSYSIPVQIDVASKTLIDNGDPGFSTTGAYAANGNVVSSLYYENDTHYTLAGQFGTATWTFTDLTAGNTYQVGATWFGSPNRTTAAPYQVAGVTGGPTTVIVNQRLQPNTQPLLDSFTADGGTWAVLGEFQATSDTMTVTLSGVATGATIADAVRIDVLQAPAPEAAELTLSLDGQPLAVGDGIDFGTLLRGESADATLTIGNNGPGTLTVVNLVLTNQPGLQMTPNGIGSGQFTTGQSFTIDVAVDASLTGLSPGTYAWDIIFDTNDANNPFVAIPIEVEVVPYQIIDDDNDSNDDSFRLGTGSLFDYYPSNLPNADWYYQDDVTFHQRAAGEPVSTVEWNFDGLLPGVYDVLLTWFGSPNRATDVPVSVVDGFGAPLATPVTINQELQPDDFVREGAPWELVFENVSVFDEGGGTGSIVFQMSDDANEFVIADAVMVEYVGPPGPALRASEHNSSSDAPELSPSDLEAAVAEATSLWQAIGLSAAEQARLANVNVHVVDLATNVLGWATEDGSTVFIDSNAAGYGWQSSQELRAKSGEPEVGIDLLTVLAHELGHVIGHEHDDDHHGVMSSTLDAGVRMLPGVEELGVRSQESGVRGQESGVGSQESGVRDQLFSGSSLSALESPLSLPHSDFRIPTSDRSALEIDSFFARLDEEAAERTDDAIDEDDRDDGDEARGESEDGLDVWSVLFG